MTKGVGIGTAILGEATGELLKPGMTKKDLEELESRGLSDGPDPFGDVFRQSESGRVAMDRLPSSRSLSAGESEPGPEVATPAEGCEAASADPTFEHLDEHSFDGVAAAALDFPYAAAQNPSGSFSVDFWARPRGGSGYRSPLASRDMPARGYTFFITPQGRWAFWAGLPEKNEWTKVDGPCVREGEWQRITGVYAAASRSLRLLVDGAEYARRRPATPVEPNMQRPLRLGAGATEGAVKFPFSGDVSRLRVYACALSEPLPENAADSDEPPATVIDDGYEIDEPPLKRPR